MQNQKVISIRQDKPDPYDTFFMQEANRLHEIAKFREKESAMHAARARIDARHRMATCALVVATWLGSLLLVASL